MPPWQLKCCDNKIRALATLMLSIFYSRKGEGELVNSIESFQ